MFCDRTKEFLRRKGIAFEEHDISQEEAAIATLEALGVYTTPVTIIDGEAVIGFDQRRLEELLGES
jgi:glutaredoxin